MAVGVAARMAVAGAHTLVLVSVEVPAVYTLVLVPVVPVVVNTQALAVGEVPVARMAGTLVRLPAAGALKAPDFRRLYRISRLHL